MLGWSRVAPSPEGLRIDGVWRRDGPELPLEYAEIVPRSNRQGRSRLSLAIVPGWKRSPVLWSLMTVGDLDEALESLAEGQGEPVGKMGYLDLSDGSHRLGLAPSVRSMIDRWARELALMGREIDAVVWSNVAPNFEEDGRKFTPRNLIEFIRACPDDEYAEIEEYVRSTPPQIRTPMRAVMERELGWTPFTIVERLSSVQARAI